MALTLYVDGDRWRAHLKDVLARHPGLVPVAKGNGYGFGLHRLARKAEWLGVDTLAVGTYDELPQVRRGTTGRCSCSPRGDPSTAVDHDPRVIHTVGRLEDLTRWPSRAARSGERPRVVLERMTSMLRHGFSAKGLRDAGQVVADGERCRGRGGRAAPAAGRRSHLSEVDRLMNDVVAAGLDKLGARRAARSGSPT